MKNIFLLILSINFLVLNAQTDEVVKEKKFGFEVTAKFGNAKLDIKDAVDLNGSFSAGDFLFVYRLDKNNMLKSGITVSEFNANFVNAGESANLTNSYLQIPIKYYYVTPLSSSSNQNTQVDLQFGLGINANYLYKAETEVIGTTFNEKNIDWNFGAVFEMGLDFSLAKYMNFGIYYEAQSDINRMNNQGNKQKLTGVNLIKFAYILNF